MTRTEAVKLDNQSTIDFMHSCKKYLKGRVLDFGAGKQPYKNFVSGKYEPYDPKYNILLPQGTFDCIICNQVFQYISTPKATLTMLKTILNKGGYLVVTYSTNWDEVEHNDYHRFTFMGMRNLFKNADFKIITHRERASFEFEDFKLVMGYGIVGRK